MRNFKTIGAWLALCLISAGGTVLAMQVIGKALGLQQIVAKVGK